VSIFDFNPPIIAHRGASAYAPENTLIAFIKAIQMGAKWIEFDIMQSASGELVIFHDENLARTTNGTGELQQCSYAYLQTLDAGSWFDPAFSGERIPSLQHVFQFVYNTQLSVNIEIKAQNGQEEKLIVQLQKEIACHLKAFHHRLLFSSFSVKSLQILRKYLPTVHIGVLIDNWNMDLCDHTSQILNNISVHIDEELLTKDRVKLIKEKDKILLAYTVNCKKRAQKLLSFGVDAIFTDKPDILLVVG
jgi:glycerophosphoryl diester phosphodiesterase